MKSYSIFELKLQVAKKALKPGPWIYSNQVVHLQDSLLSPHKTALVYIKELGRFAIYCKSILMCARILPVQFASLAQGLSQVSQQDLCEYFVRELEALQKQKLKYLQTAESEAFRWVHGDADGIPGIVIDNYHSHLVIQSRSAVGEFWLDALVMALQKISSLPILEKSTGQTRKTEGLNDRIQWLTQPAVSLENVEVPFAGLILQFSPMKSQKTGLFLDQRSNLMALQRFAIENRLNFNSVLDICCYAGAWSAAAAKVGALDFTCIDADSEALKNAKNNILANCGTTKDKLQIATLQGDMFSELAELKKQSKKFDLVVADPPAFAKSQKHVAEALRAYARLAKLASSLVSDNGILVACSCSRHVSDEDFLNSLTHALYFEEWVFIHRGMQSIDHTVAPSGIGSEYLKCYFLMKRKPHGGN